MNNNMDKKNLNQQLTINQSKHPLNSSPKTRAQSKYFLFLFYSDYQYILKRNWQYFAPSFRVNAFKNITFVKVRCQIDSTHMKFQ